MSMAHKKLEEKAHSRQMLIYSIFYRVGSFYFAYLLLDVFVFCKAFDVAFVVIVIVLIVVTAEEMNFDLCIAFSKSFPLFLH